MAAHSGHFLDKPTRVTGPRKRHGNINRLLKQGRCDTIQTGGNIKLNLQSGEALPNVLRGFIRAWSIEDKSQGKIS